MPPFAEEQIIIFQAIAEAAGIAGVEEAAAEAPIDSYMGRMECGGPSGAGTRTGEKAS